MEYCVINKGQGSSDIANKAVTGMLTEYSRQLYGFTKNEFDSIVEYDLLNIMAYFYSKMNALQKNVICDSISKVLGLYDMDDVLDNLADFMDDEVYIPLCCKLIDRLGDSRVTMIIYETLFSKCKEMTVDAWNQRDSYSNYLVLLNAAYFNALSYKFHIRDSYKSCMKVFYGEEAYDDFVESLYEKHLDDIGWDADIELDVLDELIGDSKRDNSFVSSDKEEFFDATERMEEIRLEHHQATQEEEDKEGFELIVQKTGIREQKSAMIGGFECHFCLAKLSDDEYIIVYQKDTRISDIIDKEDEWKKFQHDLYYEDIKNGQSSAMVYIVYILDNDSDNIPIQTIESNKTYGRKYVFSEEETITFINGIVKTSHDEIGAVSPVQEWDRILREEHLTGCLTEAYAAKKVDAYLSGQRFDADYVMDDDYSAMTHSAVPQVKWVKSLDTSGFRDFCFDERVMEFGQINLFFGANGSGKTSVLEAIEYALTAEVRRVKDFKVKLPTDSYPRLYIYDKEAGVHTFTPGFSKKNSKEIERVWYGVPVGRTKTNLNDNFNRFNAFDSEAAYKFIHESDNSEDSFASMFGNLMFGESVVDHEKKWQRFKKAFDDKYTELREELSDAKYWAQVYEQSLSQKSDSSKSEDIEHGIIELKLIIRAKLPKASSDRYPRIMEELTLVRKYVDVLDTHQLSRKTFAQIAADVAEVKSNNLKYVKEKKEKSDEITRLAEENGEIKKKIFAEREKQTEIQARVDRVNIDIKNWTIVQNVLSHEDTIKLVNDLLDELTKLDRELYYISKIEQRTAIVNFLKSRDYEAVSPEDRKKYEEQLAQARSKRQELENKYNEAKKAFGEKEQQAIELRKIGKTLLTDAKCPLCGHEYESTQQLIDIIDSAVVVDEGMDALISSIEKISKLIMEVEKILDHERLIDKAKKELAEIADTVPMVEKCGSDYKRLFDYLSSKSDKEKRKAEIVEQQSALDAQGFSLKNINACREYKTTDSTYLEYKRSGKGTYTEFLSDRLNRIQIELGSTQLAIDKYQRQIQQNEQKEELLRNDIHRLDSMLEALDMDDNREIEQALENLKTRFTVQDDMVLSTWVSKYHALFDKCELEVERLESQDNIAFEKQQLAEYKATIKRVEPQVARCANAVRAFEKMPSLSSFVEKGIKSNIQQISKFFKWMHHSGEFEELGIDSEGIYAIRGLNHQKIRTYEMSTGQRSTIAMAVMFALHMAAPDAPQFLLLDEPLATMDDTQVLNVLDILKSMAEQKTQIFFTTANGIMINLFKQAFKNTDFDYKEYEFVKRVNRPSEIKESSVNDTKTIEELTLDDLTLDFNQFAQIREVLRKNQEKLVAKDEWESLDTEDIKTEEAASGDGEGDLPEDNFYSLLTEDERKLLNILVEDDGVSASRLQAALSVFPTYKMMFEGINEKAVDFFGETVVENDDELPWMDDDYREELRSQYEAFSGR